MSILLNTCIGLGALIIAFVPLERAFPRWPQQGIFRPRWYTDLAFLLGQYLLWSFLVLGFLAWAQIQLDLYFPISFRQAVAEQPWLLQVIEVVVLSDILVYWAHRWQHHNAFLWRFHAVHHSAEHLDWLAAHREHPIDTMYTLTLINAPALILGFDLAPIAGFLAFRGFWAIVIHSNISFKLGWLGNIIGSPQLHHWHHHQDRDAGNYANISPLMDIVFGTHQAVDDEPRLGIDQPCPQSYVGQLLGPFRRSQAQPAETSP
jgi:sterol desaturase/sphingolipid hydroxylase (fatty acid hydroxylase superfamily)